MSEREEAMFQDLVRRASPAPRDPIFRLRVLERRETAAFRRRSVLLLAVAAFAVLGAGLFSVLRPGSIEGAAIVFFGIGAASLGFYLAPVILRRARGLRL